MSSIASMYLSRLICIVFASEKNSSKLCSYIFTINNLSSLHFWTSLNLSAEYFLKQSSVFLALLDMDLSSLWALFVLISRNSIINWAKSLKSTLSFRPWNCCSQNLVITSRISTVVAFIKLVCFIDFCSILNLLE